MIMRIFKKKNSRNLINYVLFLHVPLSYIPTLTVEGVPTKVVDSVTRAKCLDGYTCLLESTNMVMYRLQVTLNYFPAVLGITSIVASDSTS